MICSPFRLIPVKWIKGKFNVFSDMKWAFFVSFLEPKIVMSFWVQWHMI